MRVGEKETSEQAEIVRRYADLFSREQLDALREAEEGASGDERELLYRLRKTCEGGLISAELAEREDELENRLLAARVTFKGEEMPLRNAQAKLAVLPAYADREELGEIQADASAGFNDDRLELLRASEELCRRVLRHRRRRSSATRRRRTSRSASCRRALEAAATAADASLRALRETWFARLLGPDHPEVPSSYHTAYMRRLSPLEATYTKERATEICLETLDRARLRPDRAAEHQARPRRPPAEVAARLRDRERPAEGRAPDHARAGRPPRLPGVPARGRPRAPLRRLRPDAAVHVPPHRARPRADRDLLVHRRGDLARARVARAVLRPLDRAGRARTPRRRSSSRRCSSAATRRSSASSSTSGRASPTTAATPAGYEELLTEATGIRYRGDGYLSDMDAGFYSADYLRAWIRSAQLRQHLIERGRRGLVAQPADRRAAPRALPRGHEADERADRRADRLRPARHRAAAARNRRG